MASLQQSIDRLAEKLESVRDGLAGQPEDAVRDACSKELEKGLKSVDAGRRDAVLDGLRQRLIGDARNRGKGSADGNALAEVTAERDRLQAQVAQLQRDLETARSAAPASGGAATAVGGDGAMLAFRRGMEAIAGGAAPPDDPALGEGDRVMLQLCHDLLKFALDYEMGVNLLRAEMNVGQASGMDTQMLRGLQQQIRTRFKDSLEGKPGAQESLRQSLTTNAKFIVELNTAYNHALSAGTQELLGAVDPQGILEGHKRMLGHDFEKAFQEIVRVHGDLAQLGRKELWERFFAEAFRGKIGD